MINYSQDIEHQIIVRVRLMRIKYVQLVKLCNNGKKDNINTIKLRTSCQQAN